MKSRITIIFTSLVVFIVFIAAPLMAEPVQSLVLPGIGTVSVSQVKTETFDNPDAWERYSGASGDELGVEKGVYRASTPNPGYIWGLNQQEQTDVVTDVEVTPLTPFTDNGAGVMCRADTSDNGNGYYFMVNANGYYSIQIGTDNGIAPLIDWSPSKAVHQGIDVNTIRAVCIADHLAMYVNNTLVASFTDDTYSSGYAGLAVAAGNHGADMSFDNLTLYTIQKQHK